MHRPRRVAFGDVERGEIVPVVLDLGTGGDGEAKVGEDLRQLVQHLADRVDRPARRGGGGQGQVNRFGGEAGVENGGFQRFLAFGEGGSDAFAQGMDLGADCLPFLRRHAAQRLQQARDRALLAQELDPQGFQRVKFLRRANPRQRRFPGCCIVHDFPRLFLSSWPSNPRL